MNKRKKLGRGIEDFSHLFISSQDPVKGSEKGPFTKGLEEIKSSTKKIAVLSSVEDTHNSFLILNLAIGLSNEGKKVVLLDSDGTSPHINLFLESFSSSSLSLDISERRKSSCKNQWGIIHVLMDIDMSRSDYLLPEEKGSICKNLTEIDAEADIVLVFITGDKIHCLKNIIQSINVFIVPTPSCAVGMVEAYAMIKKIFLLNPDAHVGLVINEIEAEEKNGKVFKRMQRVAGNHLQKSIHHLGTIYNEPAIEESVKSRIPLSLIKPDSKNVLSFKEMAKKICSKQDGEGMPDPVYIKEKGLIEIFQFDVNGFEPQTY